jgi:hypothetical protein
VKAENPWGSSAALVVSGPVGNGREAAAGARDSQTFTLFLVNLLLTAGPKARITDLPDVSSPGGKNILLPFFGNS